LRPLHFAAVFLHWLRCLALWPPRWGQSAKQLTPSILVRQFTTTATIITVTVGGATAAGSAVGDRVTNIQGRRDLGIAAAFFTGNRQKKKPRAVECPLWVNSGHPDSVFIE